MIIICALILSVQSQVDYELHVQYGKEKSHIGSIKIPKSKSQRPQITLETDTIIDKQKLHHVPYVTLYLEGGQSQYIAHVESSHITSLNIRGNLTEIINLALVNENLVSFDYQVKQSKKGAEKYFVQLKELLPAPQGQLAQEEEKPETQQEQPQGLFGLLSQYQKRNGTLSQGLDYFIQLLSRIHKNQTRVRKMHKKKPNKLKEEKNEINIYLYFMGLYLSKPDLNKIQGHNDEFKFAFQQVQGWKIALEEKLIIKPQFDKNNSLFGIIEMQGGSDVGNFIEQNIIEILIADNDYKNGNYDIAITNIYDTLDKSLKQIYDKIQYETANLILCLITEQSCYVSNLGLARCVIQYQQKHKVMSVDHYPFFDEEKQRIIAAGGEVWENRLNANLPFSRALGGFEYKNNTQLSAEKQLLINIPSLKYVDIRETKLILLGSHGFWQTWTNSGIMDVILERINQGKSLPQILDSIIDSIIALTIEQEYGKDNISCIIISKN